MNMIMGMKLRIIKWDYIYGSAREDWMTGIKGKGSSLDIAPLTILDSGALQPRKWQLTDTGCSTPAQASGCP